MVKQPVDWGRQVVINLSTAVSDSQSQGSHEGHHDHDPHATEDHDPQMEFDHGARGPLLGG